MLSEYAWLLSVPDLNSSVEVRLLVLFLLLLFLLFGCGLGTIQVSWGAQAEFGGAAIPQFASEPRIW